MDDREFPCLHPSLITDSAGVRCAYCGKRIPPVMTERHLVQSYGGGVQSTALAVLVVQGKLPKPEVVVMSDTGREASLTWRYLKNHTNPLLKTIGIEVEVAPHSLARVDLFASSGDRRPLIPAFGSGGTRIPQFCSVEWKRDPVNRYLRRSGYGPKKPVTMWLGISEDEIHRVKPSRKKWVEFAYPLIDLELDRNACVKLVEEAGLPTPPRSSCWMCPFRSDAEWIAMRDRRDGDFGLALAFDEMIRSHGPQGDLFLHRRRVPLGQVAFRGDGQADFFDVCEEGRCEF